jgi:transcriptional regulator with XRE-family HTH domain
MAERRTATAGRAPGPVFAEELRRLREARGLNRKALAGSAGIDPSTMTRLEKGERGPSREVVDRLADALG